MTAIAGGVGMISTEFGVLLVGVKLVEIVVVVGSSVMSFVLGGQSGGVHLQIGFSIASVRYN